MEDPTTVALNLTFFGTLAVAFVMFLGLFIIFVLTLVCAGLGRGAAVAARALAGVLRAGRSGSGPRTKSAAASRAAKREGPQPAAEWPGAVARPGARAEVRSKVQAPPAPETVERRKAG